jgi:predicted transcriptional regulator of viral defense system
MSPYPRLDRLAARQQQLVTLPQCVAEGLTEVQLRHCIRRGVMVRVRRGVYRWCGARPSWRMMAMAAVLEAGEGTEGAVLSHRSAGVLWGFLPEAEGGRLEITHPKARRLVGVGSHRHVLTPDERTNRFGIPVTTVERTLLDLAESTPHMELGRMIDAAIRRNLTTTAKLDAVYRVHAGAGRRRVAAIRAALADRGVAGYDPGADEWEYRMDQLWDELGLPTAARQHKVRTTWRTYVIDRAIVELKIGVEWNGRASHGTRSGFDYDSNRRADLVSEGWLMLDFTSNSSPARIRRTIESAVARRQPTAALPA